MLLLLLFGIVVILSYFHIAKRMKYWKERGVQQGKPLWIFGHYWDSLIGAKGCAEVLQMVYQQSPNARYTGMYRFLTPVLILRDPELIKQITIKDFDYFSDHLQIVPADADPFWSKGLFSLSGSNWKNIRQHLSPSFTSSKMRILFAPMMDCAGNLVKHLQQKNQDVVTVEMTNLCSRCTNDVIASTAFGVKVDSLAQPGNDFYRIGKDVTLANICMNLKVLLYWLVPSIKNIMKIQIVSDEAGDYFRGVMNESIKAREEKGIVRQDMIHLLLEARKQAQKQNETGSVNGKKSVTSVYLTNDDITAHALVFFLAGFESVASFISFACYELAVNPDVQEKLKSEIRQTLHDCKGNLTYEALLDMKYLEMVVSETLRKWPPFVGTERVCTKPYTLEAITPNEKPVHIQKGQEITIPTHAIHHDPANFPKPEFFDPERFSEGNKKNIRPNTYLPFGIGPRICIGSRLGLLEGKILLFQLLNHFELVPVEKTAVPLKLSKKTIFNLSAESGIWLGLRSCKI